MPQTIRSTPSLAFAHGQVIEDEIDSMATPLAIKLIRFLLAEYDPTFCSDENKPQFDPAQLILGFIMHATGHQARYRAVRLILSAMIDEDATMSTLINLVQVAQDLCMAALRCELSDINEIILRIGYLLFDFWMAPMMSRGTNQDVPQHSFNFQAIASSLSGVTSRSSSFPQDIAEREDYRCAVTRVMDMMWSKKLIRETGDEVNQGLETTAACEAAHIIPHCVNQLARSSENLNERQTFFWKIMSAFAPDLHNMVNSQLIDEVYNRLYLRSEIHSAFGELALWFERLPPETHGDNTYRVKTSRKMWRPAALGNIDVVTFTDHSQTGIKLPSARLLEVHAAVAKVCEMCGASLWYRSNLPKDGEEMCQPAAFEYPHMSSGVLAC